MSMTAATQIVARGLGRVGAASLVRAAARIRRQPPCGLVLMYHRISSVPDYLGLCVSPEHFDAQLRLLRRSTRVIPLSELAERITSSGPLTEDVAAITFDDGYRDNLETAMPILARHGLPATVFVTTDFVDGRRRPVGELVQERFAVLWHRGIGPGAWAGIGDPAVDNLARIALRRPGSLAHLAKLAFSLPGIASTKVDDFLIALEKLTGPWATTSPHMLDWAGVRQLSRGGVEIGSHTVSHGILSRLPRPCAEREVVKSKHRLEAELGTAVRGFAFPNGHSSDFTQEDVDCLRGAGYAYACTADRGRNFGGTDPYRIRRLGAGDYAGGIFDLKLAVGR